MSSLNGSQTIDFDLDCSICGDLFQEVVETPCCHKCYCRGCIVSWTKKAGTCPECRLPIQPENCKKNYPIQRIVDNLPTECKFVGCKDHLTRGILQEHLQKCVYRPSQCSYSDVCQVIFKDRTQHEKECTFRKISCKFCQESIRFNQLQNHIENDCPETEITCKACKDKLIRKNLDKHPDSCLEMQINCTYSKFGCKEKMKRKELNSHLKKKATEHLKLVEKFANEKDKESEMLLKKVGDLQKELSRFHFLLTLKPRLPYAEHDEEPVLEPSHLVFPNFPDISMDDDALGCTYKNTSFFSWSQRPSYMVRGDRLIQEFEGVYYFEITIQNSGKDGAIGIGLAQKNHNLVGMPGWEGGYGYHGDDGKIFCPREKKGLPYGSTWTKDDVIGLGWDMIDHTLFFTKNGQAYEIAFRQVTGEFYPVIGLHSPGSKIRINFGQHPFKYNVHKRKKVYPS